MPNFTSPARPLSFAHVQLVVLDDRMREELLSHLLDLLLELRLRHLGQRKLQDLPRLHVGDLLVAELMQRSENGLPLRIQHPLLVCHGDLDLHPALPPPPASSPSTRRKILSTFRSCCPRSKQRSSSPSLRSFRTSLFS